MANDKGQEYTDSVISELEKKIQKEYKQANDEVQQKVDDYFARFAKKDQKKQAQLKAGYITQEEYNDWRYGQVCVGERWKELKQNLAEDYVNANQIARSMVADRQADVYAMNHNFATYQVEHDSLMDTSYTLYNRRTVQNLVKDNPRLLPYLSKDSPTAKKLSERMDMIWNRQKINSAITQGVLQGESIPQISKRLEKVTDMNHSAAVRNARTMMTSCENKGRQDAYDSLRDKGIDLAEKWVATLDGRTRHSHRHLHGTYKDPKTGLYENGLEYPGDPFGEPEEIYNCRCCEVAEVLGFKIDTPTTSPKLGDMSFDEWLNAKGGVETLKWKDKLVQKQTTVKQETTVNKPLQFKDGEAANEYFGKRPPRELRRENREEYDKRREEFEHSMYKTWYDSLSDQENQSIRNYTGDDYSGINGLLRNRMTKKMVDSWNQFAQEGYTVQEMIGNIESGIDKFTLNDPIKVFRTCDPNILDSATFKKGTIFKDNAFVSTTTITDKVASGNVVMEIEVPSGKGIGAWINPMSGKADEEYEFLINRGAMFEVGEVYQRGDDTVIEMKWIGREPEDWKYASREDVIERMKKEGVYDKYIAEKV